MKIFFINYLICIIFCLSCTFEQENSSSAELDLGTNIDSLMPKRDMKLDENSGSTLMLVEQPSRDQVSLPPISENKDLEALFHWQPIFGESPTAVGIQLLGSAHIDENGLNLSERDAFAQYQYNPTSFVQQIKEANELYISLWIKSAMNAQQGPARIFTWSQSIEGRNLTLGHGEHQSPSNKLVLRLRLNQTDDMSALQGQINGSNLISTEEEIFTVENGWYFIEIQYVDQTVYFWVNDQLLSLTSRGV